MKKHLTSMLVLIAFAALAQTKSTFENLNLPIDTFKNDVSFVSGNAAFNNFNPGTYWSGFSYSTKRDTTTPGYFNQYSARPGGGAAGTKTYAVASNFFAGDAVVRLQGAAAGKTVLGMYVTNSTYAYLSMKNGDQFAKKFGGTTRNDPDWFRLTIKAWLAGVVKPQSVEFYLADYRDPDNTKDYIVKDWRWVDLQPLGAVDSLFFVLESTDTAGGFGMNNPAYFCLDELWTSDGVVNIAPVASGDSIITTYNTPRKVDVLANDYDVTYTPLSVQILNTPKILGAVATQDSNKIVYTPAVGIIGKDTIRYRVCDQLNLCDIAMLTIDVRGITHTGIESGTATDIQIFPNPFSEKISIRSNAIIESVLLLNSIGEIVDSTNERELNTGHLPAGIYMLQVITSKGLHTKKLVK